MTTAGRAIGEVPPHQLFRTLVYRRDCEMAEPGQCQMVRPFLRRRS